MDVVVMLLKLPKVEKRTGKKKSSIYAGVKDGTFPAPVRVGPKSVAWRSDEIDHWVDSRPRAISGEV